MTQPQRVNIIRTGAGSSRLGRLLPVNAPRDLRADIRRARWLANWLDTKFQFAGVRFGLEGLVGLIPIVGDALGALAGLYPVWVARRHDLGRAVQARMALNLVIEATLGSVPIVGDVFDIAFKANIRNVRLLEWAAERARLRG